MVESVNLERIYLNRLRAFPRMRQAEARLLTYDPGETTGWSFWTKLVLADCGQINTSDISASVNNLASHLRNLQPTAVVIEDYRVYPGKETYHVGASLHTPRVIGTLETLLTQLGIPYHKQMAGLAKGFAGDKHLQAWGLYERGQKHARDAVRHGCYFICFPPKTLYSQTIQRGTKHHVG